MMFSTLMELQKLHPPEDEILNQYLVPAICKAAAVLGMVSGCVWLRGTFLWPKSVFVIGCSSVPLPSTVYEQSKMYISRTKR